MIKDYGIIGFEQSVVFSFFFFFFFFTYIENRWTFVYLYFDVF